MSDRSFLTYRSLQKDEEIFTKDEVLVRGTVKATAGFSPNVLVELFSKTDQYTALIRRDHVLMVATSTDVQEPGDKSWVLQAIEGPFGNTSAYHRDDRASRGAAGKRRQPAHWFSVSTSDWLTWDMVIREIGEVFTVVSPDVSSDVEEDSVETDN